MRRVTGSLLVIAAGALATLAVACGSTGDDESTEAADEARSTPAEQATEQPLSTAEERGRALFVAKCGSCHTLGAAGTQGQVGPDLNELQVDEADVLVAIANGGTGGQVMPKNLVEGEEAKAVAAFVAASGP